MGSFMPHALSWALTNIVSRKLIVVWFTWSNQLLHEIIEHYLGWMSYVRKWSDHYLLPPWRRTKDEVVRHLCIFYMKGANGITRATFTTLTSA